MQETRCTYTTAGMPARMPEVSGTVMRLPVEYDHLIATSATEPGREAGDILNLFVC